MPTRWNENRLTGKLEIDYPIIQGPVSMEDKGEWT